MVRQPLLVLDGELRVVTANRAYYETFQLRPRQIEGELIGEIGGRAWSSPELREKLEMVLPLQRNFDAFRVEGNFPKIGRRRFLLRARRLAPGIGAPARILVVMEEASTAETIQCTMHQP